LLIDDRAVTNKYNLYSPYTYSNLDTANIKFQIIPEREVKYDLLVKLMVN